MPPRAAKQQYLAAMRVALVGAVRHVLTSPFLRGQQLRVRLRPRHVWNLENAEAVDPVWARHGAQFFLHDSDVLRRLARIVRRSPSLWRQVSAQPAGYTTTHVANYVAEDLEGLLEKYFSRRPTQRGVSDALIDELMRNYSSLLDSDTHDASAVLPIIGLEGRRVRRVDLGSGVRLRKLSAAELEEKYNYASELGSRRYSRSDVQDWDFCLEADMRIPRAKRPSVWLVWEDLYIAMTALRMATEGRIGATVGWIKPAPPTMLDISDRVVRVDMEVGDPRRTRLTQRYGTRARRAFSTLKGGTFDNRLTLALHRYNFASERTYYADQLIDSWIALETLFAPDRGTEIRYRVRLRAARFLGRTASERQDMFRLLGKSYDARSSIVHGDSAPRDLVDLTEQTKRLLSDAILGWLDPTRPHDVESLDAAALGR